MLFLSFLNFVETQQRNKVEKQEFHWLSLWNPIPYSLLPYETQCDKTQQNDLCNQQDSDQPGYPSLISLLWLGPYLPIKCTAKTDQIG